MNADIYNDTYKKEYDPYCPYCKGSGVAIDGHGYFECTCGNHYGSNEYEPSQVCSQSQGPHHERSLLEFLVIFIVLSVILLIGKAVYDLF